MLTLVGADHHQAENEDPEHTGYAAYNVESTAKLGE